MPRMSKPSPSSGVARVKGPDSAISCLSRTGGGGTGSSLATVLRLLTSGRRACGRRRGFARGTIRWSRLMRLTTFGSGGFFGRRAAATATVERFAARRGVTGAAVRAFLLAVARVVFAAGSCAPLRLATASAAFRRAGGCAGVRGAFGLTALRGAGGGGGGGGGAARTRFVGRLGFGSGFGAGTGSGAGAVVVETVLATVVVVPVVTSPGVARPASAVEVA